MPPKGHRSGSSGRPGARSNSSTKVAANLQFTQKDAPPSKHSDKHKKAGHGNEKAPLARASSSQRVQSREQLQPMKRGISSQRVTGKSKPGFTIASPKSDDDEDDDWVSSESGAATPNIEGSDSETASEADSQQALRHENGRISAQLPRIETARLSDFVPCIVKLADEDPYPPTPTVSHRFTSTTDTQTLDVKPLQLQLHRMNLDTTKESGTDQTLPAQPSPRPPSQIKRSSRPPSTYSQSGKSEHRPHPLIRGVSMGHVGLGKPAPLAPLTVVTGGAAPPQLSTSPASSVHEDGRSCSATSPASTTTSTSFPDDPARFLRERRVSISSARSISNLPIQSLFRSDSASHPRARTLSTMSTSTSSAALSALAHLPAITRPPSPQSVVFFPPVNPHANIDAIHPLLPGPYLSNHLTVLARRNPLRESHDRVIRAKAEAARQTH